MSGTPNEPRVGIFWDYENVCPPAGVPGYIVADKIRNVAHNFGSVTVFRAYLELSSAYISPKVINLRSELQSSGVSLTDCPRPTSRKDVADKMILVDMMAFALDNPAPAVVVLISGDRDFVYAVSVLRHRRYTVVLIIPPQGAHITLKSQANHVLDWKFDIFAQQGGDARETTPPFGIGGMLLDNSSKSEDDNDDERSSSPSPRPSVPHSFTEPSLPSQVAPSTPPQQNNLILTTPIDLANDVTPLPFPAYATTTPSASGHSKHARHQSLGGSPLKGNQFIQPVRSDSQYSLAGSSETNTIMNSNMFSPLIEVLEQWRVLGNTKPLRSQVGGQLKKTNPLIYNRAGVDSFKEYVERAVELGIAKIGNGTHPGKEWISLDKKYQGKVFPTFSGP